MLDEGAPTSTGGVNNAARLCDALSIPLKLRPPRESYSHGWGGECHGAKPIKWTWDLTVPDSKGLPTAVTFDLVDGDSPLIVGLDIKRYADTMNRSLPKAMIFKRPGDSQERSFFTYIAKDEDDNDRIRFEILPHLQSTLRSLMGSAAHPRDIAIVKKVHRFSHASASEMKKLFRDAERLTQGIEDSCTKVWEACDICASSGRPRNAKKVSLTHVNEAFNNEIQADFVVVYIQGKKFFILNIVDAGTRYGERTIAQTRDAVAMQELVETEWLYHHGSPAYFSADPEFCKPVFDKFLQRHNIELRARPARSSHKNGRVERNNGIFKSVLDRLSREKTSASPATLIARASFMANLFHGSSVLSAFQLARGYSPSVVGVPSTTVPSERLQAHVEVMATRALHKALKSKDNNTERKEAFAKGMRVWVFYKTSQKNQRVRWVEARVVEAMPHLVKCRRNKRGPPMTVSYEDIRIAPRGLLAQEMMLGSLEDELDRSYNEEEQQDEVTTTGGCGADDATIEEATNEAATAPEEQAIGADMMDVDTESARIPTEVIRSDEINAESPTRSNLRDKLLGDIFGDDSDDGEGDVMRKVGAFFTKMVIGEPERDVGDRVNGAKGPDHGTMLESSEHLVLEEMHRVLGSDQVTRRHMEFAPQWILDKAVKTELDANWSDAYLEVDELRVPRRANVIHAHFVYKIKVEEDNRKRLKARLCPHGNRDRMKGRVRNDSATAQFDVIRLLCSLAAILDLMLGCIDIQGAYLQSGPIQREIYVKPPQECNARRGVLWKLVKLPYGITEAGRQWAKVIEGWLTDEGGFERVFGVPQLFVMRTASRDVRLLLAKVTDDMLLAGSKGDMRLFVDKIGKRFPVSKAVIGTAIKFNGCDVGQDEDGNVSLSMNSYLNAVEPVDISPARKKMVDARAEPKGIAQFRALAGEFVWVGSGALAPESYAGSWMQQRVPKLRVEDLLQSNGILAELKNMRAELLFKIPPDDAKKVTVTSFSDAAVNITKSSQYGQTGLVTGIRFHSEAEEGDVYHTTDWTSVKQKRVSYSSYGAEILACTEADDREYNLKMSLASIFFSREFPHELHVDSKGLFDTITTLHEGRDYRLRQTVQIIRDSFEAGELNVVRWIQGPVNIADGLTKRNLITQRMFNRVAWTGILCLPPHRSFYVDSAEWK